MQEHIKIFTGISIIANRLRSILKQANIPSIIKDESESGRLAGFGTPINSTQLFILNTDLELAQPIIDAFQKEITE